MGLYDKYARLAGERLQLVTTGYSTILAPVLMEVYSATEGRSAIK